MDRVYHVTQRPFDQIGQVGIAIREVTPQQRHVGLLYRDSTSKRVVLLHLGWHFDLRREAPLESDLWVDPRILPRRLTQVAAYCRLVWRANGKNSIPFGFAPPNDCLDAESGRYLRGPVGFGLTCASFVLAVFHGAGLVLAQYDTWPPDRPGDAEWRRSIVDALRTCRPPAKPEHIDAVERDVGMTSRFRPEEVAAAATVTPTPVPFEIADGGGQKLLARLRNPLSAAP